MRALAIFGITNDALNLAVNLLLLFMIVLYLALIFWTFSDARRRMADPLLVGCATAASLFPFVGTLVYLIVRPPEYLDDVRERELEIAAAEARLAQLDEMNCQYCDFEIESSFLRCPSCLRRLKEPCATCGKPLDPRWKICPYCEAEIGQASSQRRPRRSPGQQPVGATLAGSTATEQRAAARRVAPDGTAAEPRPARVVEGGGSEPATAVRARPPAR